MKLEQLSLKQEKLLETIKNKWVGLVFKDNSVINRAEFFKGIDWIYKLLKLNTPIKLILDSPLACQIAANVLSRVWSQVGSQVRSQVGSQVRSQVEWQVMSQVGSQVRSQVESQVWSQVGSQVRSQVMSQVMSQVGSRLKYFETSGLSLLWSSYWISFYDYFHSIGIIKSNLFDKYVNYLSSGVIDVIQLNGLAIGCNKPYWIKRDAQNRLHCDDGPAILWRDGYMNYFWHGISIPELVIEHPEQITKDYLKEQTNSEVQRAIAEKIGWDKYLQLVNVELIHKWFDERTCLHYELYDFKQRSGELQPRLLKMESPELNDGTRPHYIEPVPPQLKTCQAARRWQCDPTRPEIEECNTHPGLEFTSEA